MFIYFRPVDVPYVVSRLLFPLASRNAGIPSLQLLQFLLFKIRPREARTNYFKFSFFNRYVNDWNSLPNFVISASSLNSFKTLLLNYLCK